MKTICKTTGVFLAILILTTSFTFCYGETETDSIEIKSTWAEQCETANEWELGTMEKALTTIENTPLEDLSPVHCSLFTICLQGQGITDPAPLSSLLLYLAHLNSTAPIERIEKIDNDQVFVVYKVFNEEKEAYLRILLKKRCVKYENLEKEVERWDVCGSYFIDSNKDLSYGDFSKIKIGDSASEVAAIDDTLYFDSDITETIYDDQRVFSSRKLLNDGVLIITYSCPNTELKNGRADYKVVDIYFNKNKNNINVLCKSPNRTPYLWDSVLIWAWIAVAIVILVIAAAVILILRKRRKRTTPTEAEE